MSGRAEAGRVLVTGIAGRIGRAVGLALCAADHEVVGLDREPAAGGWQMTVGDLSDAEVVDRAMRGVRTLVHLGAVPDDDTFRDRLLPSNLVGVYEVLEAARRHGVKRLVLASTGQVNWHQQLEGPLPVRVADAPTPRHWYAATKLFLEGAGAGYAKAEGASVLAVRLGWCPRTREQALEIASDAHWQDVYLSPEDAGRFFLAAVEARLAPGFQVVFAASRSPGEQVFDLEPAKRLLGWEPMDVWPRGVEGWLG